MDLIVDFDRCEGHGLCELAAPSVYRLDDEGELHLLVPGQDLPAELETAAAAGARACPVAALRLAT